MQHSPPVKAMPRQRDILSHWHVLLDDFKTSSQDFYGSLTQALKERQIPDLSVSRVNHSEGGLFSAKREYLRASLQDMDYDICAAPYGTGFFFSSWMAVKEPIPILTWLMSWFGKRTITFYTFDTRTMFQESVHRALTDTINAIGTKQGLRALSPDEARLRLRDETA